MSRPLRVFLCHASQDKPAVRELYQCLNSEGWIDPWLDKAKILPGQDWEFVIEKAVDDTDVVIICLSSQSVTKEGFVQREIRYAYDLALEKPENTIFLIPLRLDDCAVPRKLRTLHWVDYFGVNKEDSLSDLLEALQLRYDQILEKEAEIFAREQVIKKLKHIIDESSLETNPQPYKYAKKPVLQTSSIGGDEPVKLKMPIFAMGLFTFLMLSLFVWGIYTFITTKESPALLPTEALTVSDLPTATHTLMTPKLPIMTFTPTPGIGSTMVSEKDGMVMVYVPAGEFTMGSDNGEPDEKPVHQVYLDAFWIDQTEVTNAMYAKCVADGRCTPPSSSRSSTRNSYYGNSEFNDYPVIYMNWNMAKTYCEWRGARLPTEAEWEKAARGTDGRTYPWGNAAPKDTLLNYNRNVGDTTKVGNYLDGVSPYGMYDMAGNVWEWVNDWYDSSYYQTSPSSNPQGPTSGQYRVLRGGSWGFSVDFVRSASRGGDDPTYTGYVIGFRCSLASP